MKNNTVEFLKILPLIANDLLKKFRGFLARKMSALKVEASPNLTFLLFIPITICNSYRTGQSTI